MLFMDILNIIKSLRNPRAGDNELISKAWEFAKIAHKDQIRASGEEYITHPFIVAKTLAEMGMDTEAVCAGLLHDVIEDCKNHPEFGDPEKALRKEFGEEILFLVNGVSKLGELKYRGEEGRVENLRRMFLAMAEDIRVVIIRLADRLHNMQTLSHLPVDKQKRIALETMEIYAPLAKRLGMGTLNFQLEDLAFLHLEPEKHTMVQNMLEKRREEQEETLEKIKTTLRKELENDGVKILTIDSRVKHLYSLYRKLQKDDKNMDINQIYDIVALRVIVPEVADCYQALGFVHKLWKPMPGRFKDYIALPKPNGYQSLHTTVFAVDGQITEIQIRTALMHEEAEHGIVAHWAYKEAGKPIPGARIKPKLTWVNQLIELQKDATQSREFLNSLRIDFFRDRVFCFTPKGEVIDLPEGATAIDFAYAIHSDIGNSATGALINHKFMAIATPLKNGDLVEIKIQKNKKPNPEWIREASTSLAKKHIRSALHKNIKKTED